MNRGELSEKAKEIVSQAPNWNFEGDCSILQWMEQISKALENRAKATTESLDNLTKKLGQTQIGLENTQNSLNALQYTQYVEMRCQEDELNTEQGERAPEKQEPKQDILRMFLQNNLKMLQNCHEKFNFLEDSDEDEADNSALAENCIYQPRNPYNDRLLPHIYGTKLWKENWHVGLCEEGVQDFSGDEKSDVYSLSPSSSSESESTESRNAENLSQWTSSVSLNNDGFSNKTNYSIPQNYSGTPSSMLEVPVPKTVRVPESSNVPIERETLPKPAVEVETGGSLQSSQNKKAIQCKTLNLFDDNDFKSLMSEITEKTQNKEGKSINRESGKRNAEHVAKEKPKVDLFASRSNSPEIENPTPNETIATSLPETNKTFTQKSIPVNLFDSPTDEIPPIQTYKQPTQQPKVDLFEDFRSDNNIGNENFLPSKKIHEKTMISAKSLFDDDDDEDFLQIFGKTQSTTITGSEHQANTHNTRNKHEEKKGLTGKDSSNIPPTLLFDNDLLFTETIRQKSSRSVEEQSLPKVDKTAEPLPTQTVSTNRDESVDIGVLTRKNLFSDESDDFENDLRFEESKSKKTLENIEATPPLPETSNEVVSNNQNNKLSNLDDFGHDLFNKAPKNNPEAIKKVEEKSIKSVPAYLDLEPPEDIDEQNNYYKNDNPNTFVKADLFDGESFSDSNEKEKTFEADFETVSKTIPEILNPITSTSSIPEDTSAQRKQSEATEPPAESISDTIPILPEIVEPIKVATDAIPNEKYSATGDIKSKNVFPSLFDDTPPEPPSENTFSKSTDTIDKSSTIKTSGFDNFSHLFLDEPPDDDFFQTVSGNIIPVQSNLENDFFEPSSNKPKVSTTETKVEDPAHIPRGYNIGLFSDIPPEDEDSSEASIPILSKSYTTKRDSFEEINDSNTRTSTIASDSQPHKESDGADIQKSKIPKKVLSPQEREISTDITPKPTVSKLKMPNININVQALLPGATSKPVKDNSSTTKSVTNEKMPSTEYVGSTPNVSPEKVVQTESGRENILPSLCKNRVRGPIKRRASTRAGRQESYQRTLESAQKETKSAEVSKIENGRKTSNSPLNVPTSKVYQTSEEEGFNSFSKQTIKEKSQPSNKQAPRITAVNENPTHSSSKKEMKPISKLFDDFDEDEDDLFRDTNKKPQTLLISNSSIVDHTSQAGLDLNDQKTVEAVKPLPKVPTTQVSAPAMLQQSTLSKKADSSLFEDFDESEDNDDFFNSLVSQKKGKSENLKTEIEISTTPSVVDHTNQEKSLNSGVNKSMKVPVSKPLETTDVHEHHINGPAKPQPNHERKLFDDFDEDEGNDDFFRKLINPKIVERNSSTVQQLPPVNKSLNDLFASEREKEDQAPPKPTISQNVASVKPKQATASTLFTGDSTDDDDDLFRALSKPKTTAQVASKAPLNAAKTKKENKSLFSDSEDDDDLFGGSTLKATRDNTQVGSKDKPTPNTPKNTKSLAIRTKPEESKTADNPLADLLDS